MCCGSSIHEARSRFSRSAAGPHSHSRLPDPSSLLPEGAVARGNGSITEKSNTEQPTPTEPRVATALLSDLVERGLDPEQGMLFVVDGAKALRKAIRSVFGEAPVQRCIRHREVIACTSGLDCSPPSLIAPLDDAGPWVLRGNMPVPTPAYRSWVRGLAPIGGDLDDWEFFDFTFAAQEQRKVLLNAAIKQAKAGQVRAIRRKAWTFGSSLQGLGRLALVVLW